MSKVYELKNWSIVIKDDPFVAPELRKSYLNGNIYGDDRGFPEGANVTTSSIQNIVDCGDYKIISTRSSEYKIHRDDVNLEYEEIYNDAFNRLKI